MELAARAAYRPERQGGTAAAHLPSRQATPGTTLPGPQNLNPQTTLMKKSLVAGLLGLAGARERLQQQVDAMRRDAATEQENR